MSLRARIADERGSFAFCLCPPPYLGDAPPRQWWQSGNVLCIARDNPMGGALMVAAAALVEWPPATDGAVTFAALVPEKVPACGAVLWWRGALLHV